MELTFSTCPLVTRTIQYLTLSAKKSAMIRPGIAGVKGVKLSILVLRLYKGLKVTSLKEFTAVEKLPALVSHQEVANNSCL